jgi:hypothetical protein
MVKLVQVGGQINLSFEMKNNLDTYIKRNCQSKSFDDFLSLGSLCG